MAELDPRQAPYSIDLFCHVVDNFGDVGVSWRIARQLALGAHTVRLWVDDLRSFRLLCQELDPSLAQQIIHDVEVRQWVPDASLPAPGDVVIEMFGCEPPVAFVEAMARRATKSLWINIEYLSAEPWVTESHGLPSPHPRLPLTRWFFFPGFRPGTGGLPAPSEVELSGTRRSAASLYGLAPARVEAVEVFLFAYPAAPLRGLLSAWAESPRPVRCLVPVGGGADALARAIGHADATAGKHWEQGEMTVDVVPFVNQTLFDQVLAASDIAFVRGEDSFAQVQWHGRPFVWQIYPQAEAAHKAKIEAFLALYLDRLEEQTATAVKDLWRTWNGFQSELDLGRTWNAFLQHYPALETHAAAWADYVAGLGGLTVNLENFMRERL